MLNIEVGDWVRIRGTSKIAKVLSIKETSHSGIPLLATIDLYHWKDETFFIKHINIDKLVKVQSPSLTVFAITKELEK